MKQQQVVLLCLLMMVFSCQQTPKTESQKNATSEKSKDRKGKKKSLYRVPLKEAQNDTASYDKMAAAIFKNGDTDKIPIKAFTIRSIDLLEVLGLPDSTTTTYDHVRVYLGLSEINDFKLFLTPVENADLSKNEAGEDVILSGPIDGMENELGDDGLYMLDFSAPCPNTCPDPPIN